ncbi:MAG: tetratricopeptide (TPR) repeat protein [Myxococcota bacterium]|jgi:tetratricopeptide (TPR) repeat protein
MNIQSKRRKMWGSGLALVVLTSSVVALAADGERVAELFESSFAYEATGKTTAALSDVKSVLRLDPEHYTANLRAAWLNYLNLNYNESIRFYRKAAQIAPKAIEPQLGLMLPLMAAKRWNEAERVGLKVLKRDPASYLARSRLAFTHFSRGSYAKAEKHYESVLVDYPSDSEMSLGLAWTWLKQGRKADARELFGRVLRIHRKNANAKAGLKAAQ